MKIKIIKCSKYPWYKNKIGQIYETKGSNTFNYWVRDNGELRMISRRDCEHMCGNNFGGEIDEVLECLGCDKENGCADCCED